DVVDLKLARLIVGLDTEFGQIVVDPDGGLVVVSGRKRPVGTTLSGEVIRLAGSFPGEPEASGCTGRVGMRVADAHAGYVTRRRDSVLELRVDARDARGRSRGIPSR